METSQHNNTRQGRFVTVAFDGRQRHYRLEAVSVATTVASSV